MPEPFRFKQFDINQDRCSMKIGTDGVLLGAWLSPKKEPESVLDIGTGTGLIGLMAAQRFPNAIINAVEIDQDSYEQASNNFKNSSWSNRLHCFHSSFQNFVPIQKQKYDLIISNPPFFANGQKSHNQKRNQARFEDALPFENLLEGVASLLLLDGLFALIVPYDQEAKLLAIARKYNLYPSKITHVKGNCDALIKRSLITLHFKSSEDFRHKKTEITLEKERHVYTEEFKSIAQDFYLHM